MTRHGRALTLAAAAALAGHVAACGDPVVVQGDLPGIMRVVAGGGPDGAPPGGVTLQAPRGAATSAGGSLFVADPPARTIVEVLPSGEIRTVVDHGACTGSACLTRPEALAVEANGTLIVADPGAGRVWRIDVSTKAVEAVAGNPGAEPARPGAPALAVALMEPSGVAADPDGGIYVSERNGHRVWKIERSGALSAVAGVGNAGHRDGPAGQAWFRTPAGLALVGSVLYVADQGNHRVRAVDLTNELVSSPVGRGIASFAGDGGQASDAALRSPEAVAVSGDGISLYVADKGNNRIRRVNLATGVITTFAGTGDADFVGTGLEAGATPLGAPSGVAVFASAFLFISDTRNGLVWRTPVGR